ncbi:MAG: amidohydrolase family protein [Rhizobium sp.]|nr:amidohydrolase family protein [Rhizobium sp.]
MNAFQAIKADIILPSEVLKDHVLEIEDGHISRLSSIEPDGSGDPLLSFDDCYICPGFIDVHVHGGMGADFMDGTEQAVRIANLAHLKHGTTSIFPTTTTGTFDELDAMVKACENVQKGWTVRDGARIAGVHFYGPYFAEDKVGIHDPSGRRDPDREEYEYFLTRDIVKIATCAAELRGASEFYKYARQHTDLLTCGHSNSSWAEMSRAYLNGVRHVDHFWCAMSSVSSLRKRLGDPMQASMEQFVLANPGMSTEVIADGIHLSDDLLRFAFHLIGPTRTCLVTDANRAMDAPPGRHRFGPSGSGTEVISDGKSVRGLDGDLASSMHGMDHMVRTMAAAVGSDLPSVIRMATLTPAERAGINDRVGSIEVGKLADLVVLERDLRVKAVLVGGELAYARSCDVHA